MGYGIVTVDFFLVYVDGYFVRRAQCCCRSTYNFYRVDFYVPFVCFVDDDLLPAPRRV